MPESYKVRCPICDKMFKIYLNNPSSRKKKMCPECERVCKDSLREMVEKEKEK